MEGNMLNGFIASPPPPTPNSRGGQMALEIGRFSFECEQDGTRLRGGGLGGEGSADGTGSSIPAGFLLLRRWTCADGTGWGQRGHGQLN